MPVIGLTGAIGSGKSTVARVFARHGAVVIDADTLGHEMLRRGGPCLDALVEAFGADILDGDGEVVRRVLGERAFASKEATGRLNAIVHPPLVAELQRRTRAADAPDRAVVVDAALLLEWGSPVHLARLIVVVAPEDVRERRVAERTGLSVEDVRRRAGAQMGEDEKARRADIVLVNDAGVETLEARAERAWLFLRSELQLEDTAS